MDGIEWVFIALALAIISMIIWGILYSEITVTIIGACQTLLKAVLERQYGP